MNEEDSSEGAAGGAGVSPEKKEKKEKKEEDEAEGEVTYVYETAWWSWLSPFNDGMLTRTKRKTNKQTNKQTNKKQINGKEPK